MSGKLQMRQILLKITNFTQSLSMKEDLIPLTLGLFSALIVVTVLVTPNTNDSKVNGAYNVALALGSGAAGMAAPKGGKKSD